MKTKSLVLALALSGSLFLFSGCGAAVAVQNVETPVGIDKKVTEDQIYKAIRMGAYKRGWRVKKIEDGMVEAYINVRNKHQATVTILYSHDTLEIKYKNSNNLEYNVENNTIHKNYNTWVKNLENDILFELTAL